MVMNNSTSNFMLTCFSLRRHGPILILDEFPYQIRYSHPSHGNVGLLQVYFAQQWHMFIIGGLLWAKPTSGNPYTDLLHTMKQKVRYEGSSSWIFIIDSIHPDSDISRENLLNRQNGSLYFLYERPKSQQWSHLSRKRRSEIRSCCHMVAKWLPHLFVSWCNKWGKFKVVSYFRRWIMHDIQNVWHPELYSVQWTPTTLSWRGGFFLNSCQERVH